LEADRTAGRSDMADEEKVIPWAEGNGLWRTISQLLSDLPGVDIAAFFVQNPYACDSVEGLAVRVGRRVSQIEPVLKRLTRAGLLQTMDIGGQHIYELTHDPHRRQTLQQYVAWLQEGYHWARMVMDQAS